MLNEMRADLCRVFSRRSSWLWTLLLLALPPLVILGAGRAYESDRILAVMPTVIYMLFFVVGLALAENIFGEEKRLGLYKNETTGGISRTELFLAKFFTSLLLEVTLWALCSLACAAALSALTGTVTLRDCMAELFSPRSIAWLMLDLLYLAMFLTIRVVVNKTSVLTLVCAAINTLFTQLTEWIQKIFPAVGDLVNMEHMADGGVLSTALLLAAMAVGVAVILLVGCRLFRHSEF